MYDLVIRGATVIDGLGHDSHRADVAVKDGRIAEIGEIRGEARRRSIQRPRVARREDEELTRTPRRRGGLARGPGLALGGLLSEHLAAVAARAQDRLHGRPVQAPAQERFARARGSRPCGGRNSCCCGVTPGWCRRA